MWFQGMSAGSTAAVGKGSQGAPLNSASSGNRPATPFAEWLQASLLSEVPSGGLSGIHSSQPGNEGLQPVPDVPSQGTLDTLLQSWLAALFQPFLLQAEALAGMAEQGDAPNSGGKTDGENPLSRLNQNSLMALNGIDQTILRQWLQKIAMAGHIQLPHSVGNLPAGVVGEQELLNWLQMLMQQQGNPPEQSFLARVTPDTLQMILAHYQGHGGQALSGQDLQSVIQEVIQEVGLQRQGANGRLNVGWNEQGELAVNLARESLMQGAFARAGSGRDGSSGQAQNELYGNIQSSSFQTGSTQATAPADRSFLQWLTQTEASQNPVRDAAQPIPSVRLLLSRFDTLEGRGYEARFQLYPEQLGTVHVKLILHQGTLQAHLYVDNRLARDVLESQLQSLQQAFAQQGLQVDKITVAVGEDSPFHWHEQGAPFYQEQRNSAGQQHGDGNTAFAASRYQAIESEESRGQGLYNGGPVSTSHEGIDLSV